MDTWTSLIVWTYLLVFLRVVWNEEVHYKICVWRLGIHGGILSLTGSIIK